MKEGDILIICKKDYFEWCKINEIFIKEYDMYKNVCIVPYESDRKGFIRITNAVFKEHFITLAEYRDSRIDEILE